MPDQGKRLMTPKELAAEVTRNTLEGLAEGFEEMPNRRFSARQVARILRRTAEGLPPAHHATPNNASSEES